jgi:type I restriction enzyme S subunit
MKDSGNPWVREIPSDWFEKKLRYLVKLRGEKSVTTDYKKYVGLENIMSQTGQYVQTGIEVDLTENLTFEVGDILFGKLRPYLRKYWRAEFSGTASSEFVIIKGSSLNLNFLFWAIQSDSFINDVDSSTYGSKMPRASWEYMKNIKLPFPESIEEQTQIADFLDKKVAQLDKVKSLLEEQIKTLEDYRQSLIYETVTKGLDKTVPLKDSGVDWIGQIPEGWGVGKLKYYFDVQLGKMLQPSAINGNDIEIDYLRAINVQWDNISVDNLSKMWCNPSEVSKYEIMNGDLLVCEGGEVGRCGIVEYLSDRAIIQNAVHRIRSAERANVRFLNYYIQHTTKSKWFDILCNKATIAHLTSEKLLNTLVVLPSISEQIQIADFLDKKTEQINQMIAIKKEQIENINKQRQTLIYDYVTGKRRV